MALRPYSREGQLWGPSPDTILPPDHLARVVDELVESLGIDRLNRRYEHTAGEAAYDQRLLCKLWIFAYARGITSGRELARQCLENLAFRFLTDGQCPNHRTLSGFRRAKRRLLRWVFAKRSAAGGANGFLDGMNGYNLQKKRQRGRESKRRRGQKGVKMGPKGGSNHATYEGQVGAESGSGGRHDRGDDEARDFAGCIPIDADKSGHQRGAVGRHDPQQHAIVERIAIRIDGLNADDDMGILVASIPHVDGDRENGLVAFVRQPFPAWFAGVETVRVHAGQNDGWEQQAAKEELSHGLTSRR